MTKQFNSIRVRGTTSPVFRGSASVEDTRFKRSNRRLVILMFPARCSAGELSHILSALPNGSAVTGTHYSSDKAQYGLIISSLAFDPIEHGSKIPECRAIVDTTGVQFEVLNLDTCFFEPANWQYIDTRSWARKMFDYFFN